MRKKDIKKSLCLFDETKIPDKHKIIEGCGAEYRYEHKEKKPSLAARVNLLPAIAVFIVVSTIALFATAFANAEDMMEFYNYVEYRIRHFYADGSYTDKVIGSYVDKTSQASAAPPTSWMPDGIIISPEYEQSHRKDVSGYTVEVVGIGETGITVRINGGEDFRIYKNYVKIERISEGTEWDTVLERTIFQHHSTGGTSTPMTEIIETEGEFTSEIDRLSAIFAQDEIGEYRYRITVKVCSAEGDQDFGDITAEFVP
jgi:hypothetical protein